MPFTRASEFAAVAATEPLPSRSRRMGRCRIDGCSRELYGRGWCIRHWTQWRRHGNPLANCRPNHGSGREISPDGYVLRYCPEHPLAMGNGRIMEHRLIAYDEGLLVDPTDHVHHKNGIRDDNLLENLEVLSPSEHAIRHGGEIDAAAIVALYSAGLSMKAIASELGYSSSTVQKRLVDAGVPRRPWGGH